jgi:DNA-binding NarL/FixJ family response regulator
VDLDEEGTMTPTLVIIDDHAGFRAFAKALFEAEGYNVVGEAADGSRGAELVCRLLPDVVLLDVVLPDVDGFSVSERIAEEAPACAVVLTSTRSAMSYGGRVAASPARGFVGKSELSGSAVSRLTG